MSNTDEKPEDGDKIFVEDKLEFMSQLKIRSKILKVLKENFSVEEKLVIKEKTDEEKP